MSIVSFMATPLPPPVVGVDDSVPAVVVSEPPVAAVVVSDPPVVPVAAAVVDGATVVGPDVFPELTLLLLLHAAVTSTRPRASAAILLRLELLT